MMHKFDIRNVRILFLEFYTSVGFCREFKFHYLYMIRLYHLKDYCRQGI